MEAMATEWTNILGIDPGLGTVGFGQILADSALPGGWQAGYWGVVTTTQHTEDRHRLQEIHRDLVVLLETIRPDIVVVEKLFWFRNTTTLIPVAQARGVILLVTSAFNIPVVEYTPMQVKLALTGYGKADKRAVQEAVQRELQLEKLPRPDDAADALAIALTHTRQLPMVSASKKQIR
jgi:crossover junction endodeoxyribonuclease RuvC